MNIRKATKQYESWLEEQITVVAPDLAIKHTHMAEAVFPFMRATFYRWVQVFPTVCPELKSAPSVLCVGDLHVENFGTWRDIEGRLIWGVNDFDEAHSAPYVNDLVRLTASAHLALADGHLKIKPRAAGQAILKGYSEGLAAQGRPFVLAEQNKWLRDIALDCLRDPVRFWHKMDSLHTSTEALPAKVAQALQGLMPEPNLQCRVARRLAGLGSLGHQRFVALTEWRGGKIAREAKALAPSAYVWANNEPGGKILCQSAIDQSKRCPDPFARQVGRWMVRRLAPDCSRIELTDLPGMRDETALLHAMGWETANVHLGTTGAAKAIAKDLTARPADWVDRAATAMAAAIEMDWKDWQKETAIPAPPGQAVR